MNKFLRFNLVLLMCFGNIECITARQKMDILDGDVLTEKIHESIILNEANKLDLQINNCMINSISNMSFGNLTNFGVIDLMANNIKEIDSDAFSNFVDLQEVYLSQNDIKIIQKELFQQNVLITDLNLSFNKIAQIEVKTFDNLIQLRELYLEGNPLKQLECEVFNGNRKLQRINLSHTQLKHVNECLFQNLSELTYLDLSDNEIVNISENLFMNNFEMWILDLSRNRIVDVHIRAFQNLEKMEFLKLQTNNISEINEVGFRNISIAINLSDNNITALSVNLFSNNPELTSILIDNNTITHLPSGLFKHNRQLEKLSLERNQLTNITKGTFIMNGKLTYLNLAKNNISKLKAATFEGLHSLKHLDLQDNKIAILPLKIFHKVNETLEILLLNNNRLKYIHKNMFSVGMGALYVLNLGHNNLSGCEFFKFERFPRLSYLYLNNNSLKRVNNIFSVDQCCVDNSALQYLFLEFNEIELLYEESIIDVLTSANFKFLNMSNNKINEFKFTFDFAIYADITIDFRNNRVLRVAVDTDSFIARGNLYIWESIIPLESASLIESVDYYGHDNALKINKYDLTVSAVQKSIEEIQCDDDLIIVSLVITGNNLNQIDCLSKVWTLHFIDFSYNNLTSLTKKHFGKMVHLETLDISHNPLTSLDLNIFAASVNLTEFYFDECEVVYTWQYYRITELFPNLTHISMQNNSIYCPLLSTIIQKYQNSNITIRDYNKDNKIVFDSVDGIYCEAYKSIKDVLILVECSNKFLVLSIVIIVLSIVHHYNNK